LKIERLLGSPVPSDLGALKGGEAAFQLQTQRSTKQCGIPDFGMPIQGQVAAVQRQVVLQERSDASQMRARQRTHATPEEPMMHDEQVRVGVDRGQDGRLRGIDRHGEPPYFFLATYLQAVQGPRIVRMAINGEVFSDILEDRF